MIDQPEKPDAYRRRTLASLGPPNLLGSRPWADLKDFPIFPGTTLGSTPIVVPEDWLPHGVARSRSKRHIDPTLGGRLNPSVSESDGRRVESIRRALLALWMTRRTDNGAQNYKPSSWAHSSRILLRLAAVEIERRPGEDTIFSDMTSDAVQAAVEKVGAQSDKILVQAATLIRRLTDAGERGALKDFPIRIGKSSEGGLAPEGAGDFESAGGTALEEALAGANVLWRTATEAQRAGLPLPDEFVTTLIRGALWTQANLADLILDRVEILCDVAQEILAGNTKASASFIKLMRRRKFKTLDWHDRDGGEVLRADIEKAFGGPIAVEWPPRTMRDLTMWVTILQGLNLQVLALCTGARGSEFGAAVDGAAVGDGEEARFESVTYKTVKEVGGRRRDWPLHPAGVEAIRIQSRLASLHRGDQSDHLWVMVLNKNGAYGKPLLDLSGLAIRTAEHLGLVGLLRADEEPDQSDDNRDVGGGPGRSRTHANLHRWRHTVARLVALSIEEAPHVLLRLFGHDSLEMTLHYMLSSEGIAEEAKRIAEEARLVLAERALEDTLNGEASGPAAARLAAALKDYGFGGDPHASPVDDDEDDEDDDDPDLTEVAQAVTKNRRAWSLVRPGVVCTKTWNEFGPCTQGWGEPDIGACRTRCTHRLELSSARDHCRRQLDASLAELAIALEDDATMQVAYLKGRIRADLARWPEVRKDVLAASDLAREIMGAAA